MAKPYPLRSPFQVNSRILVVCALLSLHTGYAEAEVKSKKSLAILVQKGLLRPVKVVIKSDQKDRIYTVQCFKKSAGSATKIRGFSKLRFTPYSELASVLKNNTAAKSKFKLYSELALHGDKACRGGRPTIPTPAPTVVATAPPATSTPTLVPTTGAKPTNTPTTTSTPTKIPVVPAATKTATSTPTKVATNTPVATSTPTKMPTAAPTFAPTATRTPTRVPTAAPTSTPIRTSTPIPIPNTPTPTSTPVSTAGGGGALDHLSLDKYTGLFGEEEARILYNRFAFGGSPNDIAQAVSLGLEGTVNKLVTYVPEAQVDADDADIACDGWLKNDPSPEKEQRTCDASDPNDFSRYGTQIAWANRMAKTANPFFERFAFWLHDERLSVSHHAANNCELHAIRTYLYDLRRSAISGDYINYMRLMNNSHLLHLKYLDGASNMKTTPNENYAREFWEIGTVGPTALDGSRVYSDLDIAQASRAFTGWDIEQTGKTFEDEGLCVAGRVVDKHAAGPKRIFNGTSQQITVHTDEDVLNATFNHPRTAEHLAEDLWKQFVNDLSTPNGIRGLAAYIRETNYKLLPVFRKIMLSKAMFAKASKGTLVKHPVERVIGFIRSTGFPFDYHGYDSLFNNLDQRLLEPVSVFGWDEISLANDSAMLQWYNVVLNEIINNGWYGEIKQRYGWTFYDRFIRDLHNQGKRSSLDVLDRISRELGVKLTDTQRTAINTMMNTGYSSENCPQSCGGKAYRVVTETFDTGPGGAEAILEPWGQRKTRQAVAALITLPSYLKK